jgi:hypothetical protein
LLFKCPVGNCSNRPSYVKLQLANDAVDQAFNAVLDAEKAGANVTGLLVQINTAQGILAQAENSYRTGNANTAANLADSVLPIAQQVKLDAQSAKQTAIVSEQNAFWSTNVWQTKFMYANDIYCILWLC